MAFYYLRLIASLKKSSHQPRLQTRRRLQLTTDSSRLGVVSCYNVQLWWCALIPSVLHLLMCELHVSLWFCGASLVSPVNQQRLGSRDSEKFLVGLGSQPRTVPRVMDSMAICKCNREGNLTANQYLYGLLVWWKYAASNRFHRKWSSAKTVTGAHHRRTVQYTIHSEFTISLRVNRRSGPLSGHVPASTPK